MSETWKTILDTNRDQLTNGIDINHGLLTKLLSNGVISANHKSTIEAVNPDFRKTDTLLEIIKHTDINRYHLFREVLSIENSDLVRDYLPRFEKAAAEMKKSSKRGERDLEDGTLNESEESGNIPMKRKRQKCEHERSPVENTLSNDEVKKRVRAECYTTICASLDPAGHVLELLCQKKIITLTEKEKIDDLKNAKDRCSKLLYKLLEGENPNTFLVFRDALKKDYEWIVDMIDGKEAAVKKPTLRSEPKQRHAAAKANTSKHDGTDSSSEEVDGEKKEESENDERQKSTRPGFEEPPAEMKIDFENVSSKQRARIEKEMKAKTAYPGGAKYKGKAVIINNEKFDAETRLSLRKGAEFDAKNLKKLLTGLKFDCELHRNKSAEEVLDILKEAGKWKQHSQSDCFLVFLLSHGEKGRVFGTDGEDVYTKEVMRIFNGKYCPQLIGKPKLIFIQACQGWRQTSGVSCKSDGEQDPDDALSFTKETMKFFSDDISVMFDEYVTRKKIAADGDEEKLHEMADFLVTYSVVQGYKAWRHEDLGSLFVRCLVDVFSSSAHKTDLEAMVTQIIDKLHEMKIGTNCVKQLANKQSTLRKKVYLLPN